MLERIQLLRNVGQFDSVDTGANIPLTKLSLIYAENGRGKTTLAAILRSLGTGDARLITDRARLGAANPPHIVVRVSGRAPAIFQNGAWSATVPDIAVFDDAFVAQNVCSGIDIATEHRQNLHELVLGAQGVALNAALQTQVTAIEDHNRDIKAKSDAIPVAARGGLSVDAFCELPAQENIDEAIRDAERGLAAAEAEDQVRQAASFIPLSLPTFDVAALDALLRRALPELENAAAQRVQAHLRALGDGGEGWVGDGMKRIPAASAGLPHEACPFCIQDLRGSPIMGHYRAYFSEAYANLKHAVADATRAVSRDHGGDVPAAFERAIREAVQRRQFWQRFVDVPEVAIDTAEIARAWKAARDAVLTHLRSKQAAPLEPITIEACREAIRRYETYRAAVIALSDQLQAVNGQIAIVKERAAASNMATLKADIARLRAAAARHSPEVTARCEAYLDAKRAKAATEALREQARADLDRYRATIFGEYETAINTYLQRFNAGFRLGRVSSVNTRGGSACTYNVVINNTPVSITAPEGPSFRNTLSAGDRNTLALAFFFASLDKDPNLAQKIVVIDDPMTSLDEHRSLTTVQETRRLANRVMQVIVLSHSKPFLAGIWQDSDTTIRSAMRISREAAGSTLEQWNVHHDCITQHDRRHALVATYTVRPDPAEERNVAAALRHMLEAFMRVAYPEHFPPGAMLGAFHNLCSQRVGTPNEILDRADTDELRDLLDYANRFHHDTNDAWQTEIINDQELLGFCRRTVTFTRR